MIDLAAVDLISRSFFHHSDSGMGGSSQNSSSSSSSSNSSGLFSGTCPTLPTPLSDGRPVINGLTVRQFLSILAGLSAALTTVMSLFLFTMHACNVRNPAEQIKIMRIILFVPIFSILSALMTTLGQNSIYVQPWANFYEASCLCTFFMLVNMYISPNIEQRATYFAKLVNKKDGTQGMEKLYRSTQWKTFQVIPVTFIIAIGTDISQAVGTYCINSSKPHFTHIWFQVVNVLSTSIAITAVIKFTYLVKGDFPAKKMVVQLWAFKGIIGLSVIQSFAFNIAAGHITPTDTLSYNDITVGLPNALLCVELVIFAAFFFKAYSWKKYLAGGPGAISVDGQKQNRTLVNPCVAAFKALFPIEVFSGMFEVFTNKWSVTPNYDQMEPLRNSSNAAPYGNEMPTFSQRGTSPYGGRGSSPYRGQGLKPNGPPQSYRVEQRWPSNAPRDDPQAYEEHVYAGADPKGGSYTPVDGRYPPQY